MVLRHYIGFPGFVEPDRGATIFVWEEEWLNRCGGENDERLKIITGKFRVNKDPAQIFVGFLDIVDLHIIVGSRDVIPLRFGGTYEGESFGSGCVERRKLSYITHETTLPLFLDLAVLSNS